MSPAGITRWPAGHAEQALGLGAGQFPFDSHFVDVGDTAMHFIDEGRGPVLLMVHGNPTWSFVYRHLVARLRQEFRCIAVDLPGFGLTPAPAGFDYRPDSHAERLARLVRQLGLQGATLVAHDWGGPIGLAAAQACPQALERFVLGNTWAWPVAGQWHFEWFSALMGGALGRFMAPRWNLFVNGVLPRATRRGRLAPQVLQAYRAPFQRRGDWTGTHVLPRSIVGESAFLAGVEGFVRSLDPARVMLLWPDGDIAFRATERDRWRQLLPGVECVPLARCGHYPWEEAPGEASDAILSWFDSTGR